MLLERLNSCTWWFSKIQPKIRSLKVEVSLQEVAFVRVAYEKKEKFQCKWWEKNISLWRIS